MLLLKIRSQSLQSFMPTTGINCSFILTFTNRLADWALFTLMNTVNSEILIRIKRPLVCQRICLFSLSSGLLDAQFCLCCHTENKIVFPCKAAQNKQCKFPMVTWWPTPNLIFIASVNFYWLEKKKSPVCTYLLSLWSDLYSIAISSSFSFT